MDLKISHNHLDKKIGFGGLAGKPLSNYTQDDLRKLAILAKQSNDPSLIELFDGQLPDLEELQGQEVKKQVQDIKKK